MKKTQVWFAFILALVVAGATTTRAVEEGQKDGKATVRSVHGDVQYLNQSAWMPVKVNMKFAPGATIRTGSDGTADINVNGTSSAVRLTNNTTLQIPTMSYVGSQREGDTTTMLNLVTGTVLGNVKKISANSRYEITTPHGVAGIRGTDFLIEAIPTQDGKFTVTFNSITGIITVSAIINGVAVTHTLTTGTSWEIGESPRRMDAQIIQNYQTQILNLVQAIENGFGNGNGPGTFHGNGNNGGNGAPPANPTSPFPGGVPPTPPNTTPPQGPPAS